MVSAAQKIVVRGIVAGFIGATILAVWFLAADTLLGRPLYTPTFLAATLLRLDPPEVSFGAIAVYTLLHYAAFFAVGIAVAWLMGRLEVAPSILLGAVLGFLLFDIVFYFGVVFTGVEIVHELGWPSVLAGNLLAGIGLMAYLAQSLEKRGVSWLEGLSRNRIVREGVLAGLLGAAAVALWFLAFDLFRGQAFLTPGSLGSALFLGVRDLGDVEVTLLTVGGYTLVHVAAFAVAGLVAAVVFVAAERAPALLLLGLLMFVTFEAFFIGLLAVAAEWLLGALGWGAIGVGNLVATIAVGAYLLAVHPRLRYALVSEELTRSDAVDELAGDVKRTDTPAGHERE